MLFRECSELARCNVPYVEVCVVREVVLEHLHQLSELPTVLVDVGELFDRSASDLWLWVSKRTALQKTNAFGTLMFFERKCPLAPVLFSPLPTGLFELLDDFCGGCWEHCCRHLRGHHRECTHERDGDDRRVCLHCLAPLP